MLKAHFANMFFLYVSFFLLALRAVGQKINWINCTDQPPNQYYSSINETDLPSTLKCGQILVPMDYSRPISPTNNITLGLAMYRPTNPKGVVFFQPGGSSEVTSYAWDKAFLTQLNVNGSQIGTPDIFEGLEDFDLMSTKFLYAQNDLTCQ